MSLRLSLPPAHERVGGRPEPVPAEVAAWLSTLDPAQPATTAQALIDCLAPMNRGRMRVGLRQEVTEQLIEVGLPLVPRLTETLDAATIPVAPGARNAAALADELLAEFAYSYKLLLVEQARRLFGLASSGRAQIPVVRAMQLLAERVRLSYRMYASVPKGLWLELHTLYLFALKRGFAHRSAIGRHLTPMGIYTRTLLVAFTEPLKLMQGDLARIDRWLARYGNRAQLSSAEGEKRGQGLFLIKTQRDNPGHALAKRFHPPVQPHDLILRTQALADLLLEQSARLAAGETPTDVGLPRSMNSADLPDLLARLAKQWGGTPARRHERLRKHARVDVHVGIEGIWQFLNGPDSALAPVSGWIITNQSASGFALTHDSGELVPLRVGDVIGIRTSQGDNCHICVVRWVLSDHPGHIEAGVEEMAPSARAVSIREDAARDPQPALLLSDASAETAAAVLAPLMALDTTCELKLGELATRVRKTQTVERTVAVQVLQFDPVS